MKLVKITLITGKLTCLTGMHIGAGEAGMHIGGTDSPVIKTNERGKEYPYVPGSSLKGKIRSLLCLTEENNAEYNDNKLYNKLFGSQSPQDSSFTRLFFWDCFLSEEWKKTLNEKDLQATETKVENKIDRIKGTAQHPRVIERVIKGTEFDFKLTLKQYEGDDEEALKKIILKGLKLLEADSLGGSGSRGYGKVKFSGLKFGADDMQKDFEAIKLF